MRWVFKLARWVFAVLVLLFFVYWATFVAFWVAWGEHPAGPTVLTRATLFVSGMGLLGIGGMRAVLGKKMLSPWLLLALVLPGYAVVDNVWL